MSTSNIAYRKAQELAAALKNEAALLAFEEAAKEEPTNFKPLFGVGLMLQRLDRNPEAITALSRVIEMEPRIAEAYYSRALSFQRLEQYSRALTDLDRALELQPEDTETIYARGVSLRHLDRYEEASDTFSTVLSKVGRHPAASHGRATIRYAMGDYAGAIVDFSACLAGGIDSYGVRLLRGVAFFYVGRHSEAVADLSHAISLEPETVSAYFRRSQVYRAMGDDVNAAKDFERGARLGENRKQDISD